MFHTFNTLSGIGSPNTFNGILAPSQAFYVKTDAGKAGSDVFMRANKRIHDVAKSSLKSGKASETNILRVKLANEFDVTDEAVIALRANGDMAFNRKDSEQRFTTNNLSYIYSTIDGNKAVINVLPADINGHSQTIGIQAKAGRHRLSIDGIDGLTSAYTIELEDKLDGVFMLIDGNTEYEFTTEAGTFDDRFVLHFKSQIPDVPTDINDAGDAQRGVNIYVEENSHLKVTCEWEEKNKTLSVYNVQATRVIKEEFEGEVFDYDLNVPSGIYIVEVRAGQKLYKQKVFIREVR